MVKCKDSTSVSVNSDRELVAILDGIGNEADVDAEVVTVDVLGFENLCGFVLVLDVDFVAVGVPVLLVEVHGGFSIL